MRWRVGVKRVGCLVYLVISCTILHCIAFLPYVRTSHSGYGPISSQLRMRLFEVAQDMTMLIDSCGADMFYLQTLVHG